MHVHHNIIMLYYVILQYKCFLNFWNNEISNQILFNSSRLNVTLYLAYTGIPSGVRIRLSLSLAFIVILIDVLSLSETSQLAGLAAGTRECV